VAENRMVDNICLSVLGGFVLPKVAEQAPNPDLGQLSHRRWRIRLE
jgi:hypothetical protein